MVAPVLLGITDIILTRVELQKAKYGFEVMKLNDAAQKISSPITKASAIGFRFSEEDEEEEEE